MESVKNRMIIFRNNLQSYDNQKKEVHIKGVAKDFSTLGKYMWFRGVYNPSFSLTTASNYKKGKRLKKMPHTRPGAYEYAYDEHRKLIYVHRYPDADKIHMEEFIYPIVDDEFSAVYGYQESGTPTLRNITLCMYDKLGVLYAFHNGLSCENGEISMVQSEFYSYQGNELVGIRTRYYGFGEVPTVDTYARVIDGVAYEDLREVQR